MSEKYYDLIIVGAGPAGLSAAIYSARMGLKTLVLGESLGLAAEALIIENYPGFKRISGLELVEKMREQAEEFGAVIHLPETVVDLDLKNKVKIVKTESNVYTCKAVIIATG
ncbi:MAG: FAD-dependent oxidoreductase, partial [Candidatus Bathyarchaeota archaeon]|nr:FAD-dependent oxidoreductase [Candidatus Bathyarchaeota archaeon]